MIRRFLIVSDPFSGFLVDPELYPRVVLAIYKGPTRMATSSQDRLFSDKDELASLSAKTSGLIFARYTFPASHVDQARKMAIQIASGQTLGFVPDAIESYLLHLARVTHVECQGERGICDIAFPAHLFGSDVAGLLTVLFGKISFAPGLQLQSLSADERYLKQLTGPRIGLAGIRKAVGVTANRPLLMAILKPGLGPNDDVLASNFAKLVEAGTHLVKDDEVRVDLTLDAAKRRLNAVLEAGRGRGMYVMALNAPAFELRDRALALQSAGAQAFLICPYTYGISVMQSLANDPAIKVPVFAHPAFTGIMSNPKHGIHPAVSLGTLMRWAGADAVLYPSPYGSIALPKEECQDIHRELMKPAGAMATTASVPSAGIMPEFVEQIRRDFGADVVVNAGTGMARSGATIADGAKAFLSQIETHFS